MKTATLTQVNFEPTQVVLPDYVAISRSHLKNIDSIAENVGLYSKIKNVFLSFWVVMTYSA
jgi:hypothetical protein